MKRTHPTAGNRETPVSRSSHYARYIGKSVKIITKAKVRVHGELLWADRRDLGVRLSRPYILSGGIPEFQAGHELTLSIEDISVFGPGETHGERRVDAPGEGDRGQRLPEAAG